MQLADLMKLIQTVSDRTGIPCYIVGGLPRDKVSGIASKIGDIDLTSGDKRISLLAKEVAFELRKIDSSLVMKEAIDGHISIHMKSLKIDFSSNFVVPGISGVIKRLGLKDSPLNEEVWSRDFTCNTLLMTLDFLKISDPTKRGIEDINQKMIRTILSPELAFRYNTNRIIRVIYLACKLGFNISPDIIAWVRKHPQFIKESKPEYLTKNINKSMENNKERTIELIGQMNMWDYIPISPELLPYYNKYLAVKELNG